MVVEARRLGGVDARRRRARLDRERDAGGEPAAGGVDDDAVEREAEPRNVLDDLAAGGALPGDDQGIVIGRHQHGAALLRDLARDRLAVLVFAIVQHHLGAERRGALAFGPRRVARHHDDRRHAEELRRRGDALGVIAGGERHHAAVPLVARPSEASLL